jgi:thiamine-phosphate pyrophosphorylase
MKRRQTSTPRQWLITDDRLGPDLLQILRRLPRGSGVVVRHPRLLRLIRMVAASRQFTVVCEGRRVARVHDAWEIRQAQIGSAKLLLLSPIYPTRSHPDWLPLPRMRAAALLRLAKVPVIALGGMDERRFAKVQKLGFAGWAGIDAWLKDTNATRYAPLPGR